MTSFWIVFFHFPADVRKKKKIYCWFNQAIHTLAWAQCAEVVHCQHFDVHFGTSNPKSFTDYCGKEFLWELFEAVTDKMPTITPLNWWRQVTGCTLGRGSMNESRKDPYLHQDWLLEFFFFGGGGCGWVSIAKCLKLIWKFQWGRWEGENQIIILQWKYGYSLEPLNNCL